MKVVNITTTVYGGAGRAAYRLHESFLKKSNVESSIISFDESFPDKAINCNTYRYHPSFFKRLYSKLDDLVCMTKNEIDERSIIRNQYNLIAKELKCEISSLPFGQKHLIYQPAIRNADIINLHWVAGEFLDYNYFFNNCTKPVVWTLHDMNPFMGLFHYRNDEENNKIISKALNDKVKNFKKKTFNSLTVPFEIVTPSEWLSKEAKESEIFNKFQVSTIPYSVDHSVFTYKKDNKIRSKLGINPEKIVFLFVAEKIQISRKGFQIMLNSLKQTHLPFTIVAIGQLPPQLDWFDIDIRVVGTVYENDMLAQYYSAADAVILPSVEDNLPNVMLEAMSCGTPIIGFPIGGLNQYVIDNKTGILAEDISVDALAQCIKKFILREDCFSRSFIMDFAKNTFDQSLQASSYQAVFDKLLSHQ